jgi:hypothetical protein
MNMSEWMPIETAPKDGANCLVYSEGEIKIGLFIGDKWLAEDWNGDCCGCKRELIFPTHWTPLPPPPKETL